MNLSDTSSLKLTVYASMFAALIAAGAFIAIPIGPVPIVLQNLFVLLAGLMLGPRWGMAAVGVYLLAGAVGLPVFAGGTGGIGRIFGPTGGYLLGYLPAVLVTGLISTRLHNTKTGDAIAAVAGSLIVYCAGVPWLKMVTGMDWAKAMTAGMIPFLIGDAIKVIAAVSISAALRPYLNK